MPTVYTGSYKIPLEAGKSLGQIDQEKEAYTRGAENARLAIQKQQIDESRKERELIRQRQEEQDIKEQLRYETEQEQYKEAQTLEASRYKREQGFAELKYTEEKIKDKLAREDKEEALKYTNLKQNIIMGLRDENLLTPEELKEYSGARIETTPALTPEQEASGEFRKKPPKDYERIKVTKPTVTEQKNKSVRDWQDNLINDEDLLRKYPTDTKMIKMVEEKRFSEAPLGAKPLEQALSFWDKIWGKELDVKTAEYSATIKTNGDFQKFLAMINSPGAKQRKENEGIDVDMMIKHYKEIGLIEE